MSGYIKLHRKFLQWGWFDDRNTRDVFLYLLLTANWQENEWQGVTVMPGQVIVGRKKMAAALHLTENEIRTALAHLKQTGEIRTQTTNRWTLVTIENWALYQSDDDTSHQQTTNESPTNHQQITTNEEVKNIRNKDNTHVELLPYDEIVDAWNRICISLPRVKKLTDVRKRMIRTRLKHNDLGDILTAMKAVEASDFLSGRSGEWRASFDWLMNSDSNIIKVLEGNYENRQKVSKTQNEFEAARRRIMEQYERAVSAGA